MGLRDVALRICGGRSLMPAIVIALSMTVFLSVPSVTPAAAQSMSLPGKFGVSGSGAATYSIPIAVPPATAGMAPGLGLTFSSQGSNGIVGIGWSLSGLPSITRCPQTIAQDGWRGGVNFDGNDRFCLDGQRLMVISGAYGADGAEYRTEIESFNRVISHGTAGNGPAWFEVHTKPGQIMEFGNTADSQVLAQGKPTARSWAVNKVSDTKGNYFTVTYTNDTTNGQAYPIEIDYTGNAAAGLAPISKVLFLYAARPDVTPAYQAGSLMQTTVRLTNVQTFINGNFVTDYRLAYDPAITNLSSLTSVTVCAGDGSCLPATTFSATSNSGATLNPGSFGYPNGWNFGSPPTANWTPIVGDFNADSKTDFLFVAGDVNGGPNIANVFLSNGDGTFSISSFNFWVTAGDIASGFPQPPTATWTPIVGDFNGDGKTDFAFVAGSTADIFLSNGDGTFSQNEFDFGWNFGAPPTANWTPVVGDFNGDNKTDFAFVTGSSIAVFLSNGDGTFATIGSGFSGSLGSPPTQYWTPIVADFNGDGKTDFAFVTGNWVATWLSNGDGTFSQGGFNSPWNFGQPPDANWTPLVGDFNGDGKTDFAFVTASSIAVFLSKGDGSFATIGSSFSSGSVGSPPTAGWTPIVGDFNGDGKTDFAFVTGTWVATWLSNGDGTFTQGGFNSPWDFGGPPDNNWTPIVGDFNGDGKTDFAFFGATFLATFQTGGPQFYQLNTVTTGLGATTTITYLPLTNSSVYVKDTASIYPVLDVVAPLYVVSRVDTSNGIGGNYSTSYDYVGAKADPGGRGFFGFRQMQALDLQTNILATTNFRQDYPYIGLTASQTKTLNGAPLSAAYNAYSYTWLGGTRDQVFLTQSQASSVDLDGSVLPTVNTSYQYDAYGNATQIVASTTDGHTKTTTNTYTNDTTNWLLGRLTNATVTSQTSQGGSSPPPVASTPVAITLLESTRNFNLWNYVNANNMVTGTPGQAFYASVYIASGVTIESNSPTVPAFDTGAVPPGSALWVTNAGTIAGAGGTGGAGGWYMTAAAPGGAGGPGLRAQVPLTLANNGSIWGGGGGGGGGADASDGYNYFGGGGGGGGAGFGAGGGVGPGFPGSRGTLTAGGAGGAGNLSGNSSGGTGGTGGGTASWGAGGGWSTGAASTLGPGAGGAPGPAVVGNSFITWTATGDLRGTLN